MLQEREIQLLKSKSLHLDCPRIELTRCDGAKQYAGPGYIRQNLDQGFCVAAFVPGKIEHRQVFERWNAACNRAGTLIPPGEYWTVKAIDTRGRSWCSDRILHLDEDGCVNRDEGFVVKADCHRLRHQYAKPRREGAELCVGVTLRCFSKFSFPPNNHSEKVYSVCNEVRSTSGSRNVASFQSCGFDFTLIAEEDQTNLFASSTSAVTPSHLTSRISESLLFAIGILPTWSVIRLDDGNIITEEISNVDESENCERTRQPARFQFTALARETWQLFDLYLNRILTEGDADRLHPLSAQLWAVARAQQASVEGRALTVSVAIESVLSQYFGKIAEPSAEQKAAVESVQALIREWRGDSSIRERALTTVGGIKGARPGDRLRELERRGLTTVQDRRAWRKLRNAAAHGDWRGVQSNLQQFVDDIEQVRVLLYRLIFSIIGYKGKHTDWAKHGWPLVEYPPGATVPDSELPNMPDELWPLPDPRAAGVREHHERVQLFLRLARESGDSVTSFRLLMAATYSAQAMVEVMLEAAVKEQLPMTREEKKNSLRSDLPWFNLIEKLRIHDFHRFGLTPPSRDMIITFQGGPIKLHARKGFAACAIQEDGPKEAVSGDSKIDKQRPLLGRDGTFWDDETQQYVSLERVLSDFLEAAPNSIRQFEKELLP